MNVGFIMLATLALALLIKLAKEDYEELSVWPKDVKLFAIISFFSALFLGFPTYPLVFAVGSTLFILSNLYLLPVADAVVLTAVLYLFPSIKLAVVFVLILTVVDIIYRLLFSTGDIFISNVPLITETAVALAMTFGGWLIWT